MVFFSLPKYKSRGKHIAGGICVVLFIFIASFFIQTDQVYAQVQTTTDPKSGKTFVVPSAENYTNAALDWAMNQARTFNPVDAYINTQRMAGPFSPVGSILFANDLTQSAQALATNAVAETQSLINYYQTAGSQISSDALLDELYGSPVAGVYYDSYGNPVATGVGNNVNNEVVLTTAVVGVDILTGGLFRTATNEWLNAGATYEASQRLGLPAYSPENIQGWVGAGEAVFNLANAITQDITFVQAGASGVKAGINDARASYKDLTSKLNFSDYSLFDPATQDLYQGAIQKELRQSQQVFRNDPEKFYSPEGQPSFVELAQKITDQVKEIMKKENISPDKWKDIADITSEVTAKMLTADYEYRGVSMNVASDLCRGACVHYAGLANLSLKMQGIPSEVVIIPPGADAANIVYSTLGNERFNANHALVKVGSGESAIFIDPTRGLYSFNSFGGYIGNYIGRYGLEGQVYPQPEWYDMPFSPSVSSLEKFRLLQQKLSVSNITQVGNTGYSYPIDYSLSFPIFPIIVGPNATNTNTYGTPVTYTGDPALDDFYAGAYQEVKLSPEDLSDIINQRAAEAAAEALRNREAQAAAQEELKNSDEAVLRQEKLDMAKAARAAKAEAEAKAALQTGSSSQTSGSGGGLKSSTNINNVNDKIQPKQATGKDYDQYLLKTGTYQVGEKVYQSTNPQMIVDPQTQQLKINPDYKPENDSAGPRMVKDPNDETKEIVKPGVDISKECAGFSCNIDRDGVLHVVDPADPAKNHDILL